MTAQRKQGRSREAPLSPAEAWRRLKKLKNQLKRLPPFPYSPISDAEWMANAIIDRLSGNAKSLDEALGLAEEQPTRGRPEGTGEPFGSLADREALRMRIEGKTFAEIASKQGGARGITDRAVAKRFNDYLDHLRARRAKLLHDRIIEGLKRRLGEE